MHGSSEAASAVLFGLDPMWVAAILFALVAGALRLIFGA